MVFNSGIKSEKSSSTASHAEDDSNESIKNLVAKKELWNILQKSWDEEEAFAKTTSHMYLNLRRKPDLIV